MMANSQQFAQAGALIIPSLQNYINVLEADYQNQTAAPPETRAAMATAIRRLREYLFGLQNAQLQAADESEELKRAIADLKSANADIRSEINSAKEFQENVEAAAAIADIIQRAIGLALA
ncbi:hypothetical protein [uncultured Bradyrhizobium sp.]|jgi:chromosome segregation ATPase|uniref:hypothetical protein n=1 Tax=uncultured Bradyrhizobium sp. TaxID=199684 RepID=UPI00260EA5E7|nr:hypothetical protein [uncultured Bradyrhizobium sp.]